jgi:hypothetical protein
MMIQAISKQWPLESVNTREEPLEQEQMMIFISFNEIALRSKLLFTVASFSFLTLFSLAFNSF